MPRVISVVSGKGGVGKTTLVGNVGTLLAKKYKKTVLLVDGNITTPHLGQYMGIDFCQTTLNDVLRGNAYVDEALYEHESGARILPASLELHDLKGVDISKFKNVIKAANAKIMDTDITLIDSAPGLGREAMAALNASNEVLYVTTPFAPMILDVIKCSKVAEEIGLKQIGVVVNMCHGGGHELKRNEIEAMIGLPVVSVVRHHHDVHRSLSMRKPLPIHSPRSKGVNEFDRIAEAILGIEHKKDIFATIRGFMGRFYAQGKKSAN